MNKNIIKIALITAIMFFGVFFSGIDSAKAEGDNTGYAQCYYYWEETINFGNVDGQDKPVYDIKGYNVGINVYKVGNSAGDFRGWATVGCGIGKTNNTCTIDNYNNVFHDVKRYSGVFGADNDCYGSIGTGEANKCKTVNWKCPEKIYVSKDYGSDKMTIHVLSGKCVSGVNCTEHQLSKSNIKSNGEPTELDVVKQVTQGTRTSNNSGDEIEKIQNWGNYGKNGDEYRIDGSDCTIISGELQTKLSQLFWVITIVGILLLIVMTAIEFIKVITASEEDGLKGAFKHTVIRAVCAIILLLLPVLINAVINIINDNNFIKDENGNVVIGDSGDPLCKVAQ